MGFSKSETVVFIFAYKAIPLYIGVIWGIIRYLAIRGDAIKGNVVYSRLMKSKITFSFMMTFQYILHIICSFFDQESVFFELEGYAFLYLIYFIIWLWASLLMIKEHKHDLPQVWYCHKIFWILSFLFNFAFMITLIALLDMEEVTTKVFLVIETVLPAGLIIMMLKTKRRNPPSLMVHEGGSPISERLIPPLNSGSIKTEVVYKLNPEEITFNVTTEGNRFEVKKKYIEFVEEEKRLSKFLKECKMIDILQKIPRIEIDSSTESNEDVTTICTNRAKRIREFLNVIWNLPETWTRDILRLIGIEGINQEEFIRQRQRMISKISDSENKSNTIIVENNEFSLDYSSSYVNTSLKENGNEDSEFSYAIKNEDQNNQSFKEFVIQK